MKILIDLTSLYWHMTGIERVAQNIAFQLLQLHPEQQYILLFANELDDRLKEFKHNDNVQMIIIQMKHKLTGFQLKLPLALYRLKCDVYLFNAFPEPLLFFNKKIYSTIHDVGCWDSPESMRFLQCAYSRLSYRKSARISKYIMTVSEFSKKRIVDRLGVAANKVYVVHPGVEDKFFDAANYHHEALEKYGIPETYFLSLSTLEPRKNLNLLIKVYDNLMKRNVKLPSLVLAGRKGWLMDGLLEGISETTRRKIIFTGFINDDDLPTLYHYAVCFIFPSKYEGFGIPPLEALACGTRVIASDAASIPEILGNNVCYFKSNDPLELEDRLLHYKQNSKTIDLNYTKKFNWADSTEKLYSIFDKH